MSKYWIRLSNIRPLRHAEVFLCVVVPCYRSWTLSLNRSLGVVYYIKHSCLTADSFHFNVYEQELRLCAQVSVGLWSGLSPFLESCWGSGLGLKHQMHRGGLSVREVYERGSCMAYQARVIIISWLCEGWVLCNGVGGWRGWSAVTIV